MDDFEYAKSRANTEGSNHQYSSNQQSRQPSSSQQPQYNNQPRYNQQPYNPSSMVPAPHMGGMSKGGMGEFGYAQQRADRSVRTAGIPMRGPPPSRTARPWGTDKDLRSTAPTGYRGKKILKASRMDPTPFGTEHNFCLEHNNAGKLIYPRNEEVPFGTNRDRVVPPAQPAARKRAPFAVETRTIDTSLVSQPHRKFLQAKTEYDHDTYSIFSPPPEPEKNSRGYHHLTSNLPLGAKANLAPGPETNLNNGGKRMVARASVQSGLW